MEDASEISINSLETVVNLKSYFLGSGFAAGAVCLTAAGFVSVVVVFATGFVALTGFALVAFFFAAGAGF
jgi:hypothetical protein